MTDIKPYYRISINNISPFPARDNCHIVSPLKPNARKLLRLISGKSRIINPYFRASDSSNDSSPVYDYILFIDVMKLKEDSRKQLDELLFSLSFSFQGTGFTSLESSMNPNISLSYIPAIGNSGCRDVSADANLILPSTNEKRIKETSRLLWSELDGKMDVYRDELDRMLSRYENEMHRAAVWIITKYPIRKK